MIKPANFPAFPLLPFPGDEENPPRPGNTGMSCLHVFTAAALPGVICSIDEKATREDIAKEAVDIAEAAMSEVAQRQARRR
jgi:hypothetical protein